MLSILATTVATPEKWPWTVGLQYLTNPADADGGGEPARVDLGNVRDEQHVRAALLGQPGVPLLVSRVGRQVGRLVELARVDEQPHRDKVGGCPGRSDQRKVPVVEPPHGRHQGDSAVAGQLGADLRDGAYGPRRQVTSASTS